MKYADFAAKVRHLSYFKTDLFSTLRGEENIRTLKNQIVRWQRQGKIRRLKNGIYTLNDEDRRPPLPLFLISNILHPPSYVSLESALSYFDLIPERVGQVMAVTTRKTVVYKNFYGTFRYRSLKKGLYFGFDIVVETGIPLLVAVPEKAILDKVYFDPSFQPETDYFLDHLRLQNYEGLSSTRLLQFAKRYDSKVKKGIAVLVDLIRKEKK